MSEIGVRGIDLFKIAGESISGWIPSWKLGGQKPLYFAREKCTSFYAKSVPKDSLTKIVFNRKAYQFLREKCATPDTQMPQTSATATGSPLPSPNGSWCWSC